MEKMSSFANWDKQEILHDGRKQEAKKAPAKNEDSEKEEEAQAELEALKAQYTEVTGNKPGNKKAETLLKEIEEAQKEE